MKKLIFAQALLFAMLQSSVTCGSESIRLSTGEWMPYISETSEQYGSFTQIVTEAFQAVGINTKYRFFPWKRALYVARMGELDGAIAVTKTPEREKDFWFSKEPILVGERVFFYLKDEPFEWADITDLKGIRIGATTEYYYGQAFEDAEKAHAIEVERVSTDEQNFRKLMAKRIRAFPITKEIGYYILQTEFSRQARTSVTHHPKALVSTPFYIVLSRKNPKNKQRIQAFDRGLEHLKQSGRYETLLRELEQGVSVSLASSGYAKAP